MKCKQGHLITPWASSEVHEEMPVNYKLWNLFIKTLSPPLNTYKRFAECARQPSFQRARNIEFSSRHQGLDNLVYLT